MKVIGKGALNDLKKKHADVRSQVDSWVAEVEAENWEEPQDIKKRYGNASFLPDNQVIFNLKGNKYRLWVIVSYKNKTVLVKKAGTHNEYMNWSTS